MCLLFKRVVRRYNQRTAKVVDLSAVKSQVTAETVREEKTRNRRIPQLERLFGFRLRRDGKSVTTLPEEEKTSIEPPQTETFKSTWWHKVVQEDLPTADEEGPEKIPPPQDDVGKFKGGQETDRPAVDHQDLQPATERKEGDATISEAPKDQDTKWRGFPNPAQLCYLISCLQSLLTLKGFVGSITDQSLTWNICPEAAILKRFSSIQVSQFCRNPMLKQRLLSSLQRTVAADAPEFGDSGQKDAHEFLTTVLNQISCLAPALGMTAASIGQTYRCPVKEHMEFEMVNTRTCKGCGMESRRVEVFTNLSLDLVPGGHTVEVLLDNFQKETDLEYRCSCGATMSTQRSSFVTVPKVLVLHMKRFTFTSRYTIQKVHDPVDIPPDLVVDSASGGRCLSLISAISHIGLSSSSGHYISHGVDLSVPPEDPTDRWFTYNDRLVIETSGASGAEGVAHLGGSEDEDEDEAID